ncbi:putative ABC transport system ATP-binding protein [Crossiella equi]|uniref:ABC transport system ATP-binding protein n=2 Tax=Crossiella equi TaxID=130796 RepID=A0ABS5ARV3_9PSEU|nr:putative ABC transport system ATP-binding protein [Crossiella equi]
MPVLIGVVIDQAVATGASGAFVVWLGVLFADFILLSLSYRFAARLSEGAALQAAHRVRLRITEKVLDPRGGGEGGRLSGELAAVATGDAQRFGAVNRGLPGGLAAVAALVVGAVALLRISWTLGLLVLVATPLLLWASHLLSVPLERRSHAEQEQAALASGVAADLVAGLRVLKGMGAEGTATRRYGEVSEASRVAAVRAARAQAWLEGAISALTGVFLAVVTLVAARLALAGDITVGELVTAVGLAQFLLWPLTLFSWVSTTLAQGRSSADRIVELLNIAPPRTGGDTPLPQPVLGEVLVAPGVHARAGELLGVLAPDPAEAAALVRTFRDLAVTVDGVDLAHVDCTSARATVLVAAHDAELFDGTVAENVTGPARAGALTAAGVHELAAALPDGLDTQLGEGGRALSGGQRQRVALARALARQAPVLVLHDPATAVDAVTEARLASALKEFRRGRTTVLIASSPALLAAADRVVLLHEGAVAATGTHTELMTTQPLYRDTVRA